MSKSVRHTRDYGISEEDFLNTLDKMVDTELGLCTESLKESLMNEGDEEEDEEDGDDDAQKGAV